jgi:hypothetical protein
MSSFGYAQGSYHLENPQRYVWPSQLSEKQDDLYDKINGSIKNAQMQRDSALVWPYIKEAINALSALEQSDSAERVNHLLSCFVKVDCYDVSNQQVMGLAFKKIQELNLKTDVKTYEIVK